MAAVCDHPLEQLEYFPSPRYADRKHRYWCRRCSCLLRPDEINRRARWIRRIWHWRHR